MTVSRPRRSRSRGRVTVRTPPAQRGAGARRRPPARRAGSCARTGRAGRSRQRKRGARRRRGGARRSPGEHELALAEDDPQRSRAPGPGTSTTTTQAVARTRSTSTRGRPLAARQAVGAVEDREPLEELVDLLLQQRERRDGRPRGARAGHGALLSPLQHHERAVVGGPGARLEALDLAQDRVLQRRRRLERGCAPRAARGPSSPNSSPSGSQVSVTPSE